MKAGVLGMLLLAAAGPMAASDIQISNFTINSNLILELYNQSQQSNNKLTEYPPNMNPGVISVTLRNTGATDQTPSLEVLIKDGDKPIVWGCPVQTKLPVPAGKTVVLNAMDFTALAFSGSFDQTFVDSELKNVNGPEDVKRLMTKTFKVCARLVAPTANCAGGVQPAEAGQNKESCTSLTLMMGNPQADCNVPLLVAPRNMEVPNANPIFVWSPAFNRNCPQPQIAYTLEVMSEDSSSAPIARISVPAGMTTYTWSAADPVLAPGQKYWWRAIALDCNGRPFCGPSGRGWNMVGWFTVKGVPADCRMTPQQADEMLRAKLPEFRSAVAAQAGLKPKAFRVTGAGDDAAAALLCRVRDGRATLQTFTFETK